MASLLLTSISLIIITILLSLSLSVQTGSVTVPTTWPKQFHSILFMNQSGTLQHVDLWYDYPNGRNFNIIQNQLGKLTYDLEWNNGTSYIYTLDENKECRVLHVEVGILRPDWLDGAEYLGQEYKDGFLCNVWTKVEFIWYYEDVVTNRPVFWVFYTGYSAHVMTFEVGKVLEDPKWQAPTYCFKKDGENTSVIQSVTDNGVHGNFMRGIINISKNKAADINLARDAVSLKFPLKIPLYGALQHVDLWYDYPNGRNFNIIQRQLSKLTYDLEWNNGTSYYYTLDENKECRVKLFEVGILRPDWLEGAEYLGQEYKDGFLCNVWTKVEFIWYYEDVVTKRPVSWKFFSGAVAHVMTFEVGKVLEDPQWQAPVYCFEETNKKNEPLNNYVTNFPSGIADTHSAFMRGMASS